MVESVYCAVQIDSLYKAHYILSLKVYATVQLLGHKYANSLPKLQSTCHGFFILQYEVYNGYTTGNEVFLTSYTTGYSRLKWNRDINL
jgi:hypothetical protein